MQNKRSTLIINRRLQLSEAAASAAIVILSVNLLLIFGSLVYNDYIRVSLPPAGYIFVALTEIVLLVITVIWSIRRSHRFAGPLYAIARDLRRLGEGDFTARVNLRLGDEFQPEAAAINEALESLRQEMLSIRNQGAAHVQSPAELERKRVAEALKIELDRLKSEGSI